MSEKRNDLLRQYDLIIKGLCGVYGLCLLKVLLFKYTSPFKMFSATEGLERSMNLIPFRSLISAIISTDATIGGFIASLIANVLIFVPLGIFVCLFIRKKKWLTIGVPIIFGTSFVINLLRFIFKLGQLNIDDMLQNLIGGVIGIYLFQILVDHFRTRLKVRLASICCVAGLGVLGLLLMITGISKNMTYSLYALGDDAVTPPSQTESEYYIDTDQALVFGYFVNYQDGWLTVRNVSEFVPTQADPLQVEQKGDAYYYQFPQIGAKVPVGMPVVVKTVDLTGRNPEITYAPYSLEQVAALYAGYSDEDLVARYSDLPTFRSTGEEPPLISFSLRNDEEQNLEAYDICVTVVRRVEEATN